MQSESSSAVAKDLAQLLELSSRFDSDLGELLEAGWNTSSPRLAICMAFCKAATEHAISQRVLIEVGLHGTALSLIRLQYETVVRAIWVLYGAPEDWLKKFSEPVPVGDLSEPQMGLPIPSMLDAIKAHLPQPELELRRLYQTVKVMHSFVHGGAHLVVHALRGYPPEKLISVLQNRNLLSLMLANVIVAASQSAQLQGRVRHIMNSHASCLPPHISV